MPRRRIAPAWLWLLAFSAGGVLSILVAWSCATWSPPSRLSPIRSLPTDDPLARKLAALGEFDKYGATGVQGFGWRRETVYGSREGATLDDTAGRNRIHIYDAGWPWTCMQAQRRVIDGAKTTIGIAPLPAVPGANPKGLSVIPLQPVWIGLLLNSAILGSPLFALLLAGAGRRAIRRARGRCLQCGYDLRGGLASNRACPACGTSPTP